MSEICPEVEPEIDALIHRLMQKNPDDRFQSPAELMSALEPFAVSGPIPWAPLAGTVVADATPLGGDTAAADSGEDDLSDDLSMLATNVPDEALLAPPIECVQAAREEAKRVRRRRQAILTVTILTANLLFWILFAML